ncbi:hypothetical protein NE601_17385, partial [Erysipelatoclostridium ramosum]|nr:hypothetical protein [Thomasclavelia ramosa]
KESKRKYDEITHPPSTTDDENGDKNDNGGKMNNEVSTSTSMTGDANLLEEGETSHPLKKVKILEQIDENWSK